MRQIYIIGLLVAMSMDLCAQGRQTYQLYTAKGKQTAYNKLLKSAREADVVLFGEQHDNAIAHWLQIELLKDLQKSENLVLGAEMMEVDNQFAYDAYLKGEIDFKGLDTAARLWKNFKNDYLPLLDFAKEQQLPFVATNIPRRYATQVYRNGFESLDTLSDNEKSWMAPLPIAYDADLPGYKRMMEMAQGHGGENLPKAQAIKDATMAHFILKNRKEETMFMHFNGAYHSDFYDGIYWYLKQERPELKIMTISTITQAALDELEEEHLKKADFIIVVDEDVPRTF